MGLRCSKQRHKPRIAKSQIPWLLRGAIRSNNVETLQYLFSYPNKVDPSMVIDGVCPLNLAVELGHLQMVKILIKAGASIHVSDAPRYPLHQAALFGRGPVVELLIRSGASVSALTEKRQSCLHLISHQSAERFLETAHILMQHNTNPNTLDDDGLAPLHRASLEMVTVLVSYDVTDVNICSRDGDTPLLTAVKDRRESVVLGLLRSDQQYREQRLGAKPETPPQSHASEQKQLSCQASETPHHTVRTGSCKSSNSAASRTTLGWTNSTIFRTSAIIGCSVKRASSAASVNLRSTGRKLHLLSRDQRSQICCDQRHKLHDNQRDSPVHQALGAIDLEGLSSARSRITLLNAKRFRMRSADGADLTAPAVVAPSSYSGISHLCDSSPNPDNCQRCHSFGNPSDVSGWWQSCDRLQRLLSKATPSTQGANLPRPSSRHSQVVTTDTTSVPMRPFLDINRPDKIGMTSLMIATEAGNSGLNMTVALVNAGCNVAVTDKVGMTALHHACYVGSLNVVRFLLERVLPCNGSHTNFDSMTKLAPVPPNTNGGGRVVIPELLDSQDKYGRTPIYLAACRGHTEVVNYLLSHSTDLHIPNKEHKSPLYISAYFGYLEIANALLRHGAMVDQIDSHRKTPLYVATYHGRSEIVDLLLAAGANVNAADKNGKTPLYIAVLHGHLALARKLLNSGASVNRVDREGLGPLHMAVKFPKLDIPMVKLLLNHGCDPVNLASFTRWLLMHGIIPQECIHGDDELARWLQWEECNVRSLKRLCRVAIQRALGNTDSMRAKLGRLPLPEHLLSYVSMKEL